jgi:hypothetical protein
VAHTTRSCYGLSMNNGGNRADDGFFWCNSKSGEQLGLVIRSSHKVSGIQFFTPDSFGQQLGIMSRPKGEVIEPHIHMPVSSELASTQTQEVLIMKEGRMRVDFYDLDKSYVASTVLEAGDVALMNVGGHGFEILEDCLFVEVKQGPFDESRRVRFKSTRQGEIKKVNS